METTPTTSPADNAARALALVTKLTAERHALRYIATALRIAGIPTATGRTHWDTKTVYRLQQRAAAKPTTSAPGTFARL
jgi:hypothetical protein